MQESLKHFAKRYFWGLFIINKCKFDWFFDLASTCTSDFYTSYGFIGILHSSNSFLFYSRIYPKMKTDKKGLCIMVFNITFNNISVVSWRVFVFFFSFLFFFTCFCFAELVCFCLFVFCCLLLAF
jgi:hypothetical protein